MKLLIYVFVFISCVSAKVSDQYPHCNQKWCYQPKKMQGITVNISNSFKNLDSNKQKEILSEFENDLIFLQSSIAKETFEKLKTIPIYLEVTRLKADEFPLAMYHYDLKQQKRINDDPRKIGGITFYYSKSAKDYLSYTKSYGRMFMLHEFGHPYIHHLMTQKDRDELLVIYTDAMKKNKITDSFYVGGDQIKIVGKKIHIPNLGLVRLKEALRFSGKINSAVISKTADHWFVSVQVEIEQQINNDNNNLVDRIVGVDLGINKMCTTSDGHAFEAPKPLKKYLRKLKREQRVLSKKIKFAKKEKRELKTAQNFQKQKIIVQKIHYKISNIRRDALHKLTSFLSNNYTEMAIEDLNVKGMVKNHNLARSIQDVGFGEFRRQLAYKSNWKKRNLVIVDRFYPSSKRCSYCGLIKEKLTLADRTFTCECGNSLDRDLNASFNLKQKIGRVPPEFTPVEMTAIQKVVFPLSVTSIDKSGSKHQIVSLDKFG
ncbi:MAG: transposase [Oligoflexia bacterium]|nr:transposase [Oligoflexia bacterium]